MAAPMDERINVPIDDPNADTEWLVPINSYAAELLLTSQERYPPQAWCHSGERTIAHSDD